MSGLRLAANLQLLPYDAMTIHLVCFTPYRNDDGRRFRVYLLGN